MLESKSLKLRPAWFCFSIKFTNNTFYSLVFVLDVLQLPEVFKKQNQQSLAIGWEWDKDVEGRINVCLIHVDVW